MVEKTKIKVDILNILVEIINHNKEKREKYTLCRNIVLNGGDEIKISIMKVNEKEEE